MIYDVVTFNGENDLFEIRYNVLKDFVDKFIVIEFDKTFSGKPKTSSFKFKELPNVIYYFYTEDIYGKYMELARSSPNTIGAEHWKTEFCQKESIKDALAGTDDDDIVFIGDCDEIWGKDSVKSRGKLKLRVYTYYLNNLSSEVFYGTIVYPYKDIKNECLNHLRTNSARVDEFMGWHFTSLKDSLSKKLTDSYTEDSYASPSVMANLKTNVSSNKDFLGRAFTYKVDENDWPQYLKDNKDKYKHLCKQ